MARSPLRKIVFALITGFLTGCAPDVSPVNPYDPDTPAERRQKAALQGVICGVSEDGQSPAPLPGARVRLSGPGDPFEWVTTGSDGAYRIADLIPGRYLLEVRHADHLARMVDLTLRAGESRTLDVTLEAGVAPEEKAHLYGEVRLSNELSLPAGQQDHSGVIVEVKDTGVRTVSNPEGRFDLDLAGGTYTFLFFAHDHIQVEIPDVLAPAGTDTRVGDGPVVLPPNPGTVSGVAMKRTCEPDPQNEQLLPAEGALAAVGSSHTAVADDQGRFAVTGIPSGVYTLAVSLDGADPQHVYGISVRGGETLELLDPLVLPESKGSVAGKVILSGASDHAGTLVQLNGTGFKDVTGADGSYRIEGACAGEGYELRASHDKYLTRTLGGITVEPGQVTSLVDLELARQQGGFALNGGNDYTNALQVTYLLDAPDGTVQMRMSEDLTELAATNWVAYQREGLFDLSPGEGTRTVYAQYSDGETSSGVLDDEVVLDSTAPDSPAVTIEDGSAYSRDPDGSVLVTLTAVETPAAGVDQVSGLGWVKVVGYDLQADPPPTSPGDPAYDWDGVSPQAYRRTMEVALLRPLVDEEKEIWVRFSDGAMNWSAAVSARVTLDRTRPEQASVTILDKTPDGYVSSSRVYLELGVSDESPQEYWQMRVANNDGFVGANWVPYQTPTEWPLLPGEGQRTVWAEFRDAAGNVTENAVSDTASVDVTPPWSGTVSVDEGLFVNQAVVNLSLAAVDAYEMRIAVVDVDGQLSLQDPEWETYAFSRVLTLPDTLQGEKRIEVTFRDRAGNRSETCEARTTLDTLAPEGSVEILGGALRTQDISVTLDLTAYDVNGSGVRGVRLANTAAELDSAAEVAFEPHKAWTLSDPTVLQVEETKQVWMRVFDRAGNPSEDRMDEITLDTLPPAGGISPEVTRTADPVVELTLSYSADTRQMKLSSGGACTGGNWVGVSDTTTWVLSGVDGQQQVSVLFTDSVGNLSECAGTTVTLDTTGPQTPNLQVKDIDGDGFALDATRVELEWSLPADPDVAGFVLQRHVQDESEYSILSDILGPLDGQYLDDSLGTLGKVHSYRIMAHDDLGNASGWSNIASALPYAPIQGAFWVRTSGHGYRYDFPPHPGTFYLSSTHEHEDTVGDLFTELIEDNQTFYVRGGPAGADLWFNEALNLTTSNADGSLVFVSHVPLLIDTREVVDSAAEVGRENSIAVDRQGRVHVSYLDMNQQRLKYATRQSGEWVTTDIDSMEVNASSSIGLDSNGYAHIAYGDAGLLKVASNASGSWSIETVDASGSADRGASLAVDRNDHLHISYRDSQNVNDNDLMVAENTSGSWVTTPVDVSASNVNRYTSIAVDDGGHAHVVYYYNVSGAGYLGYASDETGSWITETLNAGLWPVGEQADVAVDALGHAHVSYTYDGALQYETNAGGGWSMTPLGGTDPSHSCIGIAPSGEIFIGFQDDSRGGTLKYASSASAWQILDVALPGVGLFNDLAIDREGNLHFSYQDVSGNGDLKVASLSLGRRSFTENVDPDGEAGKHTAIAVDGEGFLHISYFDDGDDDLMYATNSSGAWTVSEVDASGNVGWHTSIAIDGNNHAHIAYRANTGPGIKCATNATGTWVSEIVDSGSNGYGTAIGVDGAGAVHISYVDYNSFDVKYATNASGAWEILAIASSGNYLLDTSLGIDSLDHVHVSCYYASSGDLRYLTNTSGSWEIATVDAAGTVGTYNSLALDGNDFVHIAYYDNDNRNLKYATNASGTWEIVTLDDAGGVGEHCAIAVDGSDRVHISYHDWTHGSLKYATNHAGIWARTTLDEGGSGGVLGTYTSIAVDGSGRVSISYADESNQDLKLASGVFHGFLPATDIRLAGPFE